MEQFFLIFFMAIIVEGLKTYVTEVRKAPTLIVPIVLGIVVSFSYNLDIFSLFGYTAKIPYVGLLLSGILIARGSNFIYDLIGRFTNGIKSEQ